MRVFSSRSLSTAVLVVAVVILALPGIALAKTEIVWWHALQSALGELPVRVRCDPAQRRDVALVPKGGHLRDGRCANTLLRARTTDLGEGGALYDEGVRLVGQTTG